MNECDCTGHYTLALVNVPTMSRAGLVKGALYKLSKKPLTVGQVSTVDSGPQTVSTETGMIRVSVL